MRRFEFVGGGSEKFWEISQSGSEVIVRFGRIDTNGQTQTKDVGSETAATAHVAKLIREKLAKGYVETGGGLESAVAAKAMRIDFSTGHQRPPVLPPSEAPSIPGDGSDQIGGVQLPSGRRLYGDPSFAPPGIEMVSGGPVLWATDGPVRDAGSNLYRLREPAAAMGLVPMLLTGMSNDAARPWDSREFGPTDPRRIDWFDAAQVLADAWRACFDEGDDASLAPVEPFGIDFPGLASQLPIAPPSGFRRLFKRSGEPGDDRDVLASLTARRVGLIAAKRPADAITAVGWAGAVNVHQDPAPMSAVLRSWEDRWTARVVEMGFDTLTLTVGTPPRDRQSAIALAAEHFAFCPDNIWQGAGTLVAYAASLQRSRMWTFWWD